jgi:trans-aconitate methyltransferase
VDLLARVDAEELRLEALVGCGVERQTEHVAVERHRRGEVVDVDVDVLDVGFGAHVRV